MHLTKSDFLLPHYIESDGSIVTKPADNIPLITWPDGRWCHVANRYIRHLYEHARSRSYRGGTLAAEAHNISHLIRYCWSAGISLEDVNDNSFIQFIDQLRDRRVDGRRRSDNAVIAIGRSSLAMLHLLGQHLGRPDYIGLTGMIRGWQAHARVDKRGGYLSGPGWGHSALPTPSPKNRRLPVSQTQIEMLVSAVVSDDCVSQQVMMRRLAMIRLLEITGGRRGEIASILAEDVLACATANGHWLRLPTLKRRKLPAPTRLVPISRHDAEWLISYVRVWRANLLCSLGVQDHGALLSSTRTGAALTRGTITNEIAVIKKKARLSDKVCAHMFRHRFITKMFVSLIEQHDLSSPDALRRLLLDGESLRLQVAEWSGHAKPESLSYYISLAFEEAFAPQPDGPKFTVTPMRGTG